MSGDDKLKNLLQILETENIESLDDLHSRLQEPAEKNLLKYSSLLRNVDEDIYKQVLQPISPDSYERIGFDEFIRNSDLELVPRSEKVFRVKENTKQTYLKEWSSEFLSSGQKVNTAFFENLISYYERDKYRYDLDLLGILILIDPTRAKENFLASFEEADKSFDLALCNDILATVEERQTLLNLETPESNELKSLCREKRQYLKARTLFSSEYYQTVFFFERRSVIKMFDDLLKETKAPASKWIFHLYATGGMGKTMFVKWLIARHCVPEPQKIPVARLDFDFLHLPSVEHYPWLLILAIAEQLNQQIEGNPFNEHLADYWHFISLLRSPGQTPGDDSRSNKEKLIKKIKAQEVDIIVSRIIDALNELDKQKPFVVFLDTLERVVLHYKPSLLAALKQLEKVHDIYPRMLLLLSGRYNLQERMTEFNTRFESKTVTHELKPFSSDEAHSYLAEKRNLQNEGIIDAIVKKCEENKLSDTTKGIGSNPFKLSLIADFYQQEIVKSPEDILNLERTDVEYLINRIITHIKEPTVQWLLRYAVVPRRFTYDIFEKVLAPRLKSELIKQGSLDKPNQSFPKGAERFENQEIWKNFDGDKSGVPDNQTIWNDLRNYASSQSWISFDTGDDGTPQLHSDVVLPMRFLLEEQQPIFKQLHDDSAAYFEKKAKAEKDRKLWAEYNCEVIYHRFQSEGKKAGKIWREKLASAKARFDPGIRSLIAEEITGRDYVDDESKLPIRRPDQEYLVNPAELIEAHIRAVEASVASIATLTRDALPGIWTNVREHLDDLQLLGRKTLLPDKNRMPFSEPVIRRLTTQMKKAKVNYPKIIPLLREAIETTTSKQMLLSFEMLFADLLSVLNDEEALKHYDRALKICKSTKYPQIKSAKIRLKIGQWYKDRFDYVSAERTYLDLLPIAKKEKNLPVSQRALHDLSDMNCELGRYGESLRYLKKVKQATKGSDVEDSLLDAFFLSQIQARNLFEPLTALSNISPFLKTGKTLSGSAAASELYGDILGMLMQFDEAITHLEKSKELWTSAANPDGADRVRMLRIGLQLFEIGDYRVVASLLSTWDRIGAKTDLELTCYVRLLRVLFEYRSDNRQAARDVWQALIKDEKYRQSPRCSIRILSMGLALGFSDNSTIKDFINELKRIEPVSARLPLLDAFQYAELPIDPSSADVEAIKRLVDIESQGKDLIPHALFRADLLDCCGETAMAERILDRAAQSALRRKNSFAYREILLAKDRLEVPRSNKDVLFNSDFLDDFAVYPNLCAAGCIEQSGRYLKQEKIQACRESLLMAQDYLKMAGGTTSQWEAKLNELFGEVARQEGNSDVAKHSYNLALSIYKKLGNKPAVEKLRQVLPQIKRPKGSSEEFFTVRMEATAKTLQVQSYSGKDSIGSQKYSSSSKELLLETVTADAGNSSIIYVFSKMYLNDPNSIESDIGKFLFSSPMVKRLRETRRNKTLPDFRLDDLTPSLAKLPWELARFEDWNTVSIFRHFYRSMSQAVGNSEQIMWLQIAMRQLTGSNLFPDGVFGLETQEGLKILKQKLKLPENVPTTELNGRIGEMLVKGKNSRNTRALVIRPRQEQQIRSNRASEFSGPGIDWWYDDNYFTVETLWWTEIDSLKDLLRKFQPHVIHIQSSFRLMQTVGQIYLDFGFEPNYEAAPVNSSYDDRFVQPSAAFINDALALLPDSKMRPLIILDAGTPPGITEIIRQLFYRNAFAAELFQLGNVSSIIAMGLCMNTKLQGEITAELIGGLSNTKSLGSIVNSLKRLSASESLEEKIPTLGIALFTNEPSLTVLSDETK